MGDLQELLERLTSGHAYRCGERPAPPQEPGVYLFAVGDAVMHVGRTKNLQGRRRNQTSPEGSQTQATFAFRMAQHRARQEMHLTALNREELAQHEDFRPLFREMKEAVREMDFRCVQIDDHPKQALFEIFASVALGSPHNSWETH